MFPLVSSMLLQYQINCGKADLLIIAALQLNDTFAPATTVWLKGT